MATIGNLVKILCAKTGIGASTIERTASELIEAGYLPDRKADLLPYDSAILLAALAVGKSPSEAVDAVTAYVDLPLVLASGLTGQGETHILPADATVPVDSQGDWELAKASAVGALGLFISEIPNKIRAGENPSIYCEFQRSTEAPLLVMNLGAPKPHARLMWHRPGSKIFSEWSTITAVAPTIFTALALAFDERSPQVSAEQPATLH